ncbi:MAG: hypothetical protein E7L17_14530 [Clostridium sp.]|uniref:hypothetical protein n=1 Tax=Clostridium sp. TaxID=1506 RepID=UPI00290C217D|nr:hypothetical protein [Clostridium sp.]MDU7339316.1 hypothetical protein [Clostridium sp.]
MDGVKSCWLCGANGNADPLDKHHLFGGALRKKSERDGLYVYLCHNQCHIFGRYAAHQCKETMQRLHEYGERKWLAERPESTIDDFIREYGKNYL